MTPDRKPEITEWLTSPAVTDGSWEEAYIRFETPEQEIAKFLKRLRRLGAPGWPPDARIVELFCGRGNGLKALERMGFASLEGVDLSRSLLEKYAGPAKLFVGDCRELRFPAESRDVIIVHGGLHHLPRFPDDIRLVFGEVHKILRQDGLFCFVEPWLTPYLRVVHAACKMKPVRWLSPRIDALAQMIEGEQHTYRQWLSQPDVILSMLDTYFAAEKASTTRGKMLFVGRKR